MTANNAENKMISRVEDQELILERIFDAPRALVFKASVRYIVMTEHMHTAAWL